MHSRMRYIAMCRACVSGRDRLFETSSPVESAKYAAVSSRISGGGISVSVCGIRSWSARSASSPSIGWLVSSDHATTRTSAPSSSRTLWSNFEATNSITSGGTGDALALGLELQDRDPRLEVRRLHVDAQTPPEPAHEPLLEPGELVRRAVRRDHDLLAGRRGGG